MAAIKDEEMPSSSATWPLHTENGQRGVWLLKASHTSNDGQDHLDLSAALTSQQIAEYYQTLVWSVLSRCPNL